MRTCSDFRHSHPPQHAPPLRDFAGPGTSRQRHLLSTHSCALLLSFDSLLAQPSRLPYACGTPVVRAATTQEVMRKPGPWPAPHTRGVLV